MLKSLFRNHAARFIVFFATCVVAGAQAPQPPASPADLDFFRYLLLTIGSPDYDPAAIQMYEDSLGSLFGLNQKEAAVIHAAGQSFRTTLLQIRQSTNAITRGKTSLSTADQTALSNLVAQREQAVASLANQILTSVTPQTAAQLRVPGKIVGARN